MVLFLLLTIVCAFGAFGCVLLAIGCLLEDVKGIMDAGFAVMFLTGAGLLVIIAIMAAAYA